MILGKFDVGNSRPTLSRNPMVFNFTTQKSGNLIKFEKSNITFSLQPFITSSIFFFFSEVRFSAFCKYYILKIYNLYNL